MSIANEDINQELDNFDRADKRTNFRYSNNKNDISIETEIFEKNSGKPVIAKGCVLNISKSGLMISLDVKYLDIAQFVKFRVLLNNPSISFEDNGRVMWGMETEDKMYYGIKIENFELNSSSNDFYQYMADNGLLYKKNQGITEIDY